MLVWVVSVRAYQPITVSICNNTMHRTLLTQCDASLLHMLHRRIRSHGRTYTSQQRLCKRYESLHTSAADCHGHQQAPASATAFVDQCCGMLCRVVTRPTWQWHTSTKQPPADGAVLLLVHTASLFCSCSWRASLLFRCLVSTESPAQPRAGSAQVAAVAVCRRCLPFACTGLTILDALDFMLPL